jgi:uncharacterized protein (TIGR02466 family)
MYPFFSSPVYKSEINSLPVKNVNYIIKDVEYVNSSRGILSKNKYILEDPELQELKSQVISHINTYLYDELKVLKSIKFKLLNSWVLHSGPNAKGDLHIHSNSLFSGVVYIKTSDNCGNLKFKSIYPDIFSNTVILEYSQFNMFNSTSWSVTPYDGLILLFPSSIPHQIEPNLSNDIRYSISFNIFIEGNIGSADDLNSLTLK